MDYSQLIGMPSIVSSAVDRFNIIGTHAIDKIVLPLTPGFYFILVGACPMKMDPDHGIVQFRMGFEKLSVTITEGFQDHRHVLAEDRLAPARSAKNKPPAYMAIYVERGRILFDLPLCQYFITHKACVPAGDLGDIVLQSDRQEEITSTI
jgi:hypothetical protein